MKYTPGSLSALHCFDLAVFDRRASLLIDSLIQKIDALLEENAELKKRIYRLELEVDLGLD